MKASLGFPLGEDVTQQVAESKMVPHHLPPLEDMYESAKTDDKPTSSFHPFGDPN